MSQNSLESRYMEFLLNKQTSEQGPEVVIVIENDGVSVGMIVDEVTKVIHATDQMVKEAPLKEDDPTRKYILNVIQSKDEMVLSINVNELLEIDKYRASLAS